MGEKTERPERRFSSFVYIVIIVVVMFSCVMLYQAWEALQKDPVDTLAGLYILTGFGGLLLIAYMMIQVRRQVKRFSFETQPIITTIICSKCELKNVRNFERGDYILKELGPCTKCEGTTMISAIYREVKDKGKEEKVFT